LNAPDAVHEIAALSCGIPSGCSSGFDPTKWSRTRPPP
jgi:hypothetical protein